MLCAESILRGTHKQVFKQASKQSNPGIILYYIVSVNCGIKDKSRLKKTFALDSQKNHVVWYKFHVKFAKESKNNVKINMKRKVSFEVEIEFSK